MINRCFAIVVLAILYLNSGCNQRCLRNSLAETIDKIRPCVIQIIVMDYAETPLGRKIEGSGFIVNDEGYVITNAHVVRTAQEYLINHLSTEKSLFIGFVGASYEHPIYHYQVKHGSRFAYIGFTVVEIDETNDIALLKTAGVKELPYAGVGGNPPTMSMEEYFRLSEKVRPVASSCQLMDTVPSEGTPVAISGYPLEITTMVSQAGIIASNGLLFDTFEENFIVDAMLNPGNSGAPVYLQDTDKVIGIARAYQPSDLQTNSGLVFVIPIKKAIDLLNKHNISWH